EIDLVGVLELPEQPLDDALVELVATARDAARGEDLQVGVVDARERGCEGGRAEIEDQQQLLALVRLFVGVAVVVACFVGVLVCFAGFVGGRVLGRRRVFGFGFRLVAVVVVFVVIVVVAVTGRFAGLVV